MTKFSDPSWFDDTPEPTEALVELNVKSPDAAIIRLIALLLMEQTEEWRTAISICWNMMKGQELRQDQIKALMVWEDVARMYYDGVERLSSDLFEEVARKDLFASPVCDRPTLLRPNLSRPLIPVMILSEEDSPELIRNVARQLVWGDDSMSLSDVAIDAENNECIFVDREFGPLAHSVHEGVMFIGVPQRIAHTVNSDDRVLCEVGPQVVCELRMTAWSSTNMNRGEILIHFSARWNEQTRKLLNRFAERFMENRFSMPMSLYKHYGDPTDLAGRMEVRGTTMTGPWF